MDMKTLSVICSVIFLGGCATAAQHKAAVQDDSADRVTVGTVQKEIRVGMREALDRVI